MRKCDWCGKEVKHYTPIINLGNRYALCSDCFSKVKNKTCRVCGRQTDSHAINGICIGCIQLNQSVVDRIKTETDLGVNFEALQELTKYTGGTFTEEDYIKWVTGVRHPVSNNYDKYKDFIIKRFSMDNIWDEENLKTYIDDIITLMNRNKDKITSKRTHIVRLEDITKFIGAAVMDKENQVILLQSTK